MAQRKRFVKENQKQIKKSEAQAKQNSRFINQEFHEMILSNENDKVV